MHPHMSSRRFRRTCSRTLVAAAVLTVSTTAACSSAQPQAADNSSLTVAAFNPFSGPDASFGPVQIGVVFREAGDLRSGRS